MHIYINIIIVGLQPILIEPYHFLLQINVLQDTDLMRFVFDNDPSTVQKRLPEFAAELRRFYSPRPLIFNMYETEFYSQGDGSLDFGRTR